MRLAEPVAQTSNPPEYGTLANSVRGDDELESGGVGGNLPIHQARHREGRLAGEARRFLPGSEAVFVPLLEIPDESDEVSADDAVGSSTEHHTGAHKLTANSDDPFLAESSGRLLDPAARRFRAIDEVADRSEDRLELGRFDRKDVLRCDGHEGVAAPVEQVHGTDVFLFPPAAKAEGKGKHGDGGGYVWEQDSKLRSHSFRLGGRGGGSIPSFQGDLINPGGP